MHQYPVNHRFFTPFWLTKPGRLVYGNPAPAPIPAEAVEAHAKIDADVTDAEPFNEIDFKIKHNTFKKVITNLVKAFKHEKSHEQGDISNREIKLLDRFTDRYNTIKDQYKDGHRLLGNKKEEAHVQVHKNYKQQAQNLISRVKMHAKHPKLTTRTNTDANLEAMQTMRKIGSYDLVKNGKRLEIKNGEITIGYISMYDTGSFKLKFNDEKIPRRKDSVHQLKKYLEERYAKESGEAAAETTATPAKIQEIKTSLIEEGLGNYSATHSYENDFWIRPKDSKVSVATLKIDNQGQLILSKWGSEGGTGDSKTFPNLADLQAALAGQSIEDLFKPSPVTAEAVATETPIAAEPPPRPAEVETPIAPEAKPAKVAKTEADKTKPPAIAAKAVDTKQKEKGGVKDIVEKPEATAKPKVAEKLPNLTEKQSKVARAFLTNILKKRKISLEGEMGEVIKNILNNAKLEKTNFDKKTNKLRLAGVKKLTKTAQTVLKKMGVEEVTAKEQSQLAKLGEGRLSMFGNLLEKGEGKNNLNYLLALRLNEAGIKKLSKAQDVLALLEKDEPELKKKVESYITSANPEQLAKFNPDNFSDFKGLIAETGDLEPRITEIRKQYNAQIVEIKGMTPPRVIYIEALQQETEARLKEVQTAKDAKSTKRQAGFNLDAEGEIQVETDKDADLSRGYFHPIRAQMELHLSGSAEEVRTEQLDAYDQALRKAEETYTAEKVTKPDDAKTNFKNAVQEAVNNVYRKVPPQNLSDLTSDKLQELSVKAVNELASGEISGDLKTQEAIRTVKAALGKHLDKLKGKPTNVLDWVLSVIQTLVSMQGMSKEEKQGALMDSVRDLAEGKNPATQMLRLKREYQENLDVYMEGDNVRVEMLLSAYLNSGNNNENANTIFEAGKRHRNGIPVMIRERLASEAGVNINKISKIGASPVITFYRNDGSKYELTLTGTDENLQGSEVRITPKTIEKKDKDGNVLSATKTEARGTPKAGIKLKDYQAFLKHMSTTDKTKNVETVSATDILGKMAEKTMLGKKVAGGEKADEKAVAEKKKKG